MSVGSFLPSRCVEELERPKEGALHGLQCLSEAWQWVGECVLGPHFPYGNLHLLVT